MPHVDYTEEEHEVWRTVCRELRAQARALRVRASTSRPSARAGPARRPHPPARRGHRRAAPADRLRVPPGGRARARCASSTARSPTASSTPRSTSATRRRRSTRPSPTSSTRSSATATMLASPRFAALNGPPARPPGACETDAALQFIADVFWFTLEFGVLHEDGELRAYGAGILSSYGEIEEFRGTRDPPAGLPRDGHAGLRHHPLPAGPVRRRARWTTSRSPSARSSRPATTTPPRAWACTSTSRLPDPAARGPH